MDLFSLIRIMFTDKVAWRQIPDSVKRNNFFMIQRRLAIRYPDIVNAANVNGVDPLAICEMYHKKLCAGSQPSWLYTKSGPKVSVADKMSIDKNNAEIIKKVMNLDSKTWESICKRKPDWIYAMNEKLENAKTNGRKNK